MDLDDDRLAWKIIKYCGFAALLWGVAYFLTELTFRHWNLVGSYLDAAAHTALSYLTIPTTLAVVLGLLLLAASRGKSLISSTLRLRWLPTASILTFTTVWVLGWTLAAIASPYVLKNVYFVYASLSLLVGLTLGSYQFFSERIERSKVTSNTSKAGVEGFQPLTDFPAQDQLDRGYLVDELMSHALRKPSEPLVIGLNGKWGSGKTSILNHLKRRLSTQDPIVVYLDAWNFRGPEEIIKVYIEKLTTALRPFTSPFHPLSSRKLALGLVEATYPRLSRVLNVFGRDENQAIFESRRRLKRTLKKLDTHVVIIVEDLDRLSTDERDAVARAINLVSDLPNTVHIIAYDKNKLEADEALSAPDSPGKNWDKIINIEIPLIFSSEDGRRLLDRQWERLLTSPHAIKDEHTVLKPVIQLLLTILQTPRDFYRVFGSSRSHLGEIAESLNAADLVVLKTLQLYRPHAFAFIQKNRDLLTEVSLDLFAVGGSQRARESLMNQIDDNDDDDKTDRALLSYLFPFLNDSARSTAEHRSHRLADPLYFEGYFGKSFSENLFSSRDYEHFLENIRTAPDASVVTEKYIEQCYRSRRVTGLWRRLWEENTGVWQGLEAPLLIGIAKSANLLASVQPPEAALLRADDRRSAARFIVRLMHYSSQLDGARLLEDVVAASSSFVMLSHLYGRLEEAKVAAFENSLLRRLLGDNEPPVRAGDLEGDEVLIVPYFSQIRAEFAEYIAAVYLGTRNDLVHLTSQPDHLDHLSRGMMGYPSVLASIRTSALSWADESLDATEKNNLLSLANYLGSEIEQGGEKKSEP